jgi:hypothetical protein
MTESMEVKYNKNSILRAGYGIIPKVVMRDKNLSIEAKAIYAYLTAFAGDKKTCYPSRDLMCEELGISINRFTKHLKTLKESGYIKVERIKSGNLKAKNIYEIIMDERDRCINFRDIENKYHENKDIENEYLENEYTNNNSLNNNSLNNNSVNNNSINKKEKKKKKTDLDVLINEYTSNSFLQETIIDFMKMRKSIKKPVTERALKGILNKLDKLATTDDIKIKILENSIENCWQGVFPLKDNFGNYNSNKYQDNNNSNSVEDLQKHQGYIDPEKMKPVSQDDLDEIDELQRELDEMGGGKIEEWL